MKLLIIMPKKINKCFQIIVYFSLLLLCACSSISSQRPNLEKLYAIQKGNPDQPPVILIHGITGSRLSDKISGAEIWPGPVKNILFSNYSYLLNKINPETLAINDSKYSVSGITDRAVGQDFYGKIQDTLIGSGGYHAATLDQAANKQQSLYIFSYDWRQDNVESARQLHEFIQAVKVQHSKPNLKVDIVAHSMGGLIARYYIRYGTVDVLNDNDFPVSNLGANHVRKVILLGTPNFGAISTLEAMHSGEKIGFKRMPPETLISFPSMYQLLPHALNDWVINLDGSKIELDIFDINTWRDLKLSIYSPQLRRDLENINLYHSELNSFATLEKFMRIQLERARRFTWSLTVPLPETKVSHIVFGGNCELTPARALLEKSSEGEVSISFRPSQIKNPLPNFDYDQLLLEPGDGRVTKASLLARQTYDPTVQRHKYSNFPLDYSLFLCEEHDKLAGNISFQDNLLNVLLSAD